MKTLTAEIPEIEKRSASLNANDVPRRGLESRGERYPFGHNDLHMNGDEDCLFMLLSKINMNSSIDLKTFNPDKRRGVRRGNVARFLNDSSSAA